MANKIHAYIRNIKNIAHAMFTTDLLGGGKMGKTMRVRVANMALEKTGPSW